MEISLGGAEPLCLTARVLASPLFFRNMRLGTGIPPGSPAATFAERRERGGERERATIAISVGECVERVCALV